MRSVTTPGAGKALSIAVLTFALQGIPASAATEPGSGESDVERLVAALLATTPIVDDLRSLTDEIGGRPTGSTANDRAVEWGLDRFAKAGVAARAEPFQMPARWLERSARATIRSPGGIEFRPQVAAMPFSIGTDGSRTHLLDGGLGTEADFARLGGAAAGAFLLIDTEELRDVPGLFAEYLDAFRIDRRARAAGARGLVFVGSRPRNVLHRHKAPLGPANDAALLMIERTAGRRALRLLREGHSLELEVELDLETGSGFTSHNVVAEIRGYARPEEFVVIGAHLDSWGLGTGALDNGANVALVIDIARQIQRLGLRPRRTIRFALWNGEEQGLYGSQGYTVTHAGELDRHVMAASFDIGTGRILGFFTGGRPELAAATERALAPIAGLGPFQMVDVPVVGTDNFDFMMHGVGNLIGNQDSANYGPNYHADTDTFDKADLQQLKLNAAIAAAVTWGFAEMEVDWRRQTRAELEALIESTDLRQQMEMFGVWDAWQAGERGRRE